MLRASAMQKGLVPCLCLRLCSEHVGVPAPLPGLPATSSTLQRTALCERKGSAYIDAALHMSKPAHPTDTQTLGTTAQVEEINGEEEY